MSQGETVGEVLDRAADLIVRDGWCQGQAKACDGRRCAMGAIGDATTTEAQYDAAKLALSRWLDVPTFGGIARWNDMGPRTAEEVIAALRAAAERARRGE